MHYAATAKFMERSAVKAFSRRQASNLFKQRCNSVVPMKTNRFFSTASATIQPTTDKVDTIDLEPTDVTNEPAYKAHFKQKLVPTTVNGEPIWENPINHAVYDLEKISTVEQTHHPITKMHERAAFLAVKALRTGFDVLSGYRGPGGAMTEKDWLNRCLFLESVAGVPGMVAGMLRHLRSLRALKRDYGWIHTLLEEAENERMHLLIFMNIKQPGYFFRALVVGAQGVFFNGFFLTYLVSPKTCHRFVGYLEEEAVKTYTCLLKDIEDGHLDAWKEKKTPLIAQTYYKLPEGASVYDMIKCVRADECNHRDVNHAFANLDQEKGVSPFVYNHH
ncbi:Alternative oxidase [Phytophthora megakarya]|uniref:Alternative oxidase n=1 Tax=Phytophthora megakarya TaxID=4795 RepID=A0A225WQL2_9STRA|nr:Alternative oxidase [Phytophthora megakarya]